jgi:hypothetical protein
MESHGSSSSCFCWLDGQTESLYTLYKCMRLWSFQNSSYKVYINKIIINLVTDITQFGRFAYKKTLLVPIDFVVPTATKIITILTLEHTKLKNKLWLDITKKRKPQTSTVIIFVYPCYDMAINKCWSFINLYG